MRVIKELLKLESFAGLLLGLAAILAITVKNSPAANGYDIFLNTPIGISIGDFCINEPILFWVNDFMMAISFLLVSLEIKREMMDGRLSTKDQMVLPAFAALGGMIFPAVIYIYFNYKDQTAIKGWAIPTATDITFALGVLAFLKNRVSTNIKICLLTLAILDDLVSVLIIAIFYAKNISSIWLGYALLSIMILAALNRGSVKSLRPYLLIGLFLWFYVLKSGIHATLAGVAVAFFIPLKVDGMKINSPLKKLEGVLYPWVTYVALPLFAFVNAGISLQGLSLDLLTNSVTLGIIGGLFFGKQLGVMLFSAIGIKMHLCKLPTDTTWAEYYGMSIITGVGFSMSLFIGTLAFKEADTQIAVRLGIIIGSLASGIVGYVFLKLASRSHAPLYSK